MITGVADRFRTACLVVGVLLLAIAAGASTGRVAADTSTARLDTLEAKECLGRATADPSPSGSRVTRCITGWCIRPRPCRTARRCAAVYASNLVGGNMRAVAEFGLDASRGTLTPPPAFNGHSPPNVPIDWLPWQDGYHTVNRDQERSLPGPAVFPQPMLTDIQFASDYLYFGLRHRFGDMTFDWLALTHGRVDLPLGEQGAGYPGGRHTSR